jgi:hypothetical protein
MKTISHVSSLGFAVLVCLLATSSAGAQQQETSRSPPSDKPCNTAVAAVGGALIGALLGGKRGALVGGAIGSAACMGANYHAKKVKSQQQVNEAYQRANGGELPEHATLVEYQPRINPAPQMQPGASSTLDSYIEVAQGQDGVAPRIEEEITLIGPDGKQLKSIRKPANESQTSGAFETQFAFTLPKGVREGLYQFRTAVYLNGENVREEQLPLQVVSATM